MRRSAEFGATVKYGQRVVQPDLVIHLRRNDTSGDADEGPRVGLIIAKSVGSAVDRHRVARRLRHVARGLVAELGPAERLVIRALPGSRRAGSRCLAQQMRAGLDAVHSRDGRR